MTTKHEIPFPTLSTDRLALRQLSDHDAAAIFSLRSDSTINKYLDRPQCTTLGEALQFIRKTNDYIKSSPLKYWGIEYSQSKKLAGTICLFGLSDEMSTCEIGYELLPHFQGKGIMKEAAEAVIDYAFKTVGLKSIDAFTHKDNQDSTKLLQNLGFEKTEISDDANPDLKLYRLTDKA